MCKAAHTPLTSPRENGKVRQHYLDTPVKDQVERVRLLTFLEDSLARLVAIFLHGQCRI